MPATEPQDQHPRPVGWKAGASAVGSVRFVLAAEAGREKKIINFLGGIGSL